ncbi:MAG: glycosyltransferase family 2 protein [Phycisphaerae bacterium]
MSRVCDFEVIAAVNNDLVFEQNLAASPAVRAGARVHAIRDAANASEAYNRGAAEAETDLLVFAHQDVYLPPHWQQRLCAAVDWLATHDPDWAVLGIIGLGDDGDVTGHTWSAGLAAEVGRKAHQPTLIKTIDELVIVLRQASGLQFDPDLPGFHLYGTDIVLSAREQGLGAYVIDAPVIHNSLPVQELDAGYEAAYRYMQRKWRHRLPLQTLVVPVTRTRLPLYLQRLKVRKRKLLGWRPQQARHRDPAALAEELGYTNPRDGSRCA